MPAPVFHVTGTKAANKAPVLAGSTGDPAWTEVPTQAALDAHAADTTSVHGIADTSVLETTTGAQTKATAAQAAAEATAASALSTHASDTTSIHGIADTSALETTTGAQTKATAAQVAAEATASGALSTHAADTTSVHGIADTSVLETTTGAASKVAAHEADTTNVHGIADTSVLETTTGAQAKANNAETAAGEYADSLFDGAVVKSPAGSDTNVITPTSDVQNLVLKLISGQTANALELKSTADALLMRLKADGTIEIGGHLVVLTNDARLSDARTPSGSAGGDLAGTFPNPTIGTGKVTPTMFSVPARPFVYIAGSYYAPPGVTGTAVMAANNETRFARIWLPKGRTIDRLGLNVTVAGSASSTIRLGLYAAAVDTGLPDGLPLIDAGTIDGTSATYQEKTVSYAIPEGNWFWLSATCQGASGSTPTVTTLSSTSVPEEGIPMFSTALSTVGLRVAGFAAGALPTATGATFALGTAPRPIVRLT